MTIPTRGEPLALFAALTTTFAGLHGLGDHWVQASRDAAGKGTHGAHLVYAADGKPVADDPGRDGRTMTASAYGRACVTRHVASYSTVQMLASVVVTRAFGVRVPARALLAGAAINGFTHAVLDRREPLLWLAARAGKAGYIQHATAVRKPGDTAAELSGPGTALMELDEAAHRRAGRRPRAAQARLHPADHPGPHRRHPRHPVRAGRRLGRHRPLRHRRRPRLPHRPR